ncbi:hypothetical protein IQ07DRAFT_558945 [Pyrenochaeta sp. DS3sAY3a]|nr:hypothetical protein IQ07DRAFT_558945 [Pyrenochaeta sp. DS3sAY3a]
MAESFDGAFAGSQSAGCGQPRDEQSPLDLDLDLNFHDFIHEDFLDPVDTSVFATTATESPVGQLEIQNPATSRPSSRPASISRESSGEGPPTKNGTRFSRAVLTVLRGWIEDHRGYPYPDESQKEMLKSQTGLTSDQITNWFANARRREKVRAVRRKGSFSVGNRPSLPMAIRGDAGLNPMERWKNSPPEQDPAPLVAIASAAQEYTLPSPNVLSDNAWYPSRPASTGSIGTGHSDSSSVSAFSAAFSQDSHGSFGSFMSHQSNKSKQSQRRRRRTAREKPTNLSGDESRVFHCTFCTDKFKNKYDWARHEKSLHLSLEKWICAPAGSPVTQSPTGEMICIFCEESNPSKEHLDAHRHANCFDKGIASRTFYRKDHLDQHLRLMHSCKITKNMASWKEEITNVSSRCGFCGLWFDTWQKRKDHLAKEFRNGRKMRDWKGSRGFDPDTAALVTHSLPPYLIDQESKTPLPFRASDASTLITYRQWSEICAMSAPRPRTLPNPDLYNHLLAPSGKISPSETLLDTSYSETLTYWESSAYYLSQFAQKNIAAGIPVTDEILQREARRVECGDADDTWNVTLADDPYWLHLFKQVHGIIPLERDFTLADLIEDFGLIATLGFSSNKPTQYDLNSISHDVLQSLEWWYKEPLSQLPKTRPRSFLQTKY